MTLVQYMRTSEYGVRSTLYLSDEYSYDCQQRYEHSDSYVQGTD